MSVNLQQFYNPEIPNLLGPNSPFGFVIFWWKKMGVDFECKAEFWVKTRTLTWQKKLYGLIEKKIFFCFISLRFDLYSNLNSSFNFCWNWFILFDRHFLSNSSKIKIKFEFEFEIQNFEFLGDKTQTW